MYAQVEAAAGLEAGSLYAFYSKNLRSALWSGSSSEEAFFAAIAEYAGLANPGHWRQVLLEIMQPLPPIKNVGVWAEKIDLAILSNHRHEWLRPLLAQTGLDQHVDPAQLFISSETGLVKPEAAAFELLTRLRDMPGEILYIDDQAINIKAARELGIEALQADPGGDWVRLVNSRLSP